MLSPLYSKLSYESGHQVQKIIKIVAIIWTSPNSLIGLLVGLLGIVTGGKVQLKRGVLEFYGGAITHILRRLPINAIAMTLGHTIIGQTANGLNAARNHEHVHVRQYERWGPLFLPAYLLSSLYLWAVKRDPYRDNPFEIEAYAKESINFDNDQE